MTVFVSFVWFGSDCCDVISLFLEIKMEIILNHLLIIRRTNNKQDSAECVLLRCFDLMKNISFLRPVEQLPSFVKRQKHKKKFRFEENHLFEKRECLYKEENSCMCDISLLNPKYSFVKCCSFSFLFLVKKLFYTNS